MPISLHGVKSLPRTLSAPTPPQAKAILPSPLLSPHGLRLSGTCFPIPGTDACPQMRARNVGTGLSKKAGRERRLLDSYCPPAPKTQPGVKELTSGTRHTVAADGRSPTGTGRPPQRPFCRASGKGVNHPMGRGAAGPWALPAGLRDAQGSEGVGTWWGDRGCGRGTPPVLSGKPSCLWEAGTHVSQSPELWSSELVILGRQWCR